jgi:hypothetical protein
MCGTDVDAITVSEAEQQLMVEGRKRLHAEAHCHHCGHRWWSRNGRALAMSRQAREAATARAAATRE